MAKRRRGGFNVFGLAFLDAMTCGLGAVVLLYMVINASVGIRADQVTDDLQGEVDRVEIKVLEGYANLAELRNAFRKTEEEHVIARGLSRRILEMLEELEVELATFNAENLSKREHLNKLKSDIASLETDAARLSASVNVEDTPGDNLRSFVGDGDRQYLTGLKIGGERILILADSSASMLDETLVNIIRFRNLPDNEKRRAVKWQQAVATVDWLTTQLPRESSFQIFTFAEETAPLLEGTDGQWLSAGDRQVLERSIQALRTTVPHGGTNLQGAFRAISRMKPRPDNVILLTDGLPTQGEQGAKRGKVSGKQRLQLFSRAVAVFPAGIPANVILLPMEGDPMAASAFWKLALATEGSFLAPAKDWP